MTANWSVQSDQSDVLNFKTSDLQIASATGSTPSFTMAHSLRLYKFTITAKNNVYNQITYNGNSYSSETWTYTSRSSSPYTSNGSTQFISTSKPLLFNSDYYYIPELSTTRRISTKAVEASSEKYDYPWDYAFEDTTSPGGMIAHAVTYPVDYIAATWNFDYSGQGKTFPIKVSGDYKMECWGAGGGYGYYSGGRFITEYTCGAYCRGTMAIYRGETFYVYIGQLGGSALSSNAYIPPASFNGGGAGCQHNQASTASVGDERSGAGGGATDIRLRACSSANVWNEYASLKTRIIVAAGAGGTHLFYSDYTRDGCHGGGITVTGRIEDHGYGNKWTPVVNQKTGNKFGIGINAWVPAGGTSNGGGGGGWYGGVMNPNITNNKDNSSSSGGSSFISGHEGCLALDQSQSGSAPKHKETGTALENSKYDEHHFFTETIMIDGRGYPWTNTQGNSYRQVLNPRTNTYFANGKGNNANGYARITYDPR